MEHYKEWNGFSISEKVYVLNHYDIEKATILDIFDDYYTDEDDFICKWVETDKGFDHLEDVFKDRCLAERAIERKKSAYDSYVTRGC